MRGPWRLALRSLWLLHIACKRDDCGFVTLLQKLIIFISPPSFIDSQVQPTLNNLHERHSVNLFTSGLNSKMVVFYAKKIIVVSYICICFRLV